MNLLCELSSCSGQTFWVREDGALVCSKCSARQTLMRVALTVREAEPDELSPQV